MLLVVMVINYCMLIINLVNVLNCTSIKMLLTTLPIAWSKKINKFLMAKEEGRDFENSTKCWICNNAYVGCDFKVRDPCHITRK